MRILFTFVGGSGHFHPLTPIARAAAAAGHEVAFSCEPVMAATVAAAGFATFPAGLDYDEELERQPLLALDSDREDQAVRESFARRRAPLRADGLLPLCAAWRPDLLVCEELDFGGMAAAELLGLPYACVLVIAAGRLVRPELIADPLAALRADRGLPPDPELAMLRRYLVLSPFPPSFRPPELPPPPTLHALSPLLPEAVGPPPPWLDGLAGDGAAPLVYFTLGTVFNMESGDLFGRVLAGLRGLPINLLVTVGPHIDPAEFGPQPANVRIERYVPQGLVLPRCAAVVSHGGSGSVIGALAHGLPAVLLPMGADQPHNADRCVVLGVAVALDPVAATPAEVAAAVSAVLDDPSYRRRARLLRAEIAALPGPEHAVALLERLAAERRPILAG
ncbi:MAG TPA: glycosyltransferase [Herpetosiphonaceae bacterium]